MRENILKKLRGVHLYNINLILTLCMNKLLQSLYWICIFSWGIVSNRYIPSNYENKRLGAIAI